MRVPWRFQMLETTLPIAGLIPQILSSLRAGSNLIITSATGSGKTTQVPQAILDDATLGVRKIIVLEPRRVACRAAARRICEERGIALGSEVGYITRFDSCTSEKTRLVFMTDGLLLRLLEKDASLSGTDVVIFDEFHERRMMSDLCLALLRRQQSASSSIKLVVMSATLHEQDHVKEFLAAEVLASEGREHPVTIEYARKRPNPHEIARAVSEQIVRLHTELHAGDILAFLPGKQEIRRAQKCLLDANLSNATILPLHGELRGEEQDQVFATVSGRKIVLATNVAETSLTIPGVTMVVDAGLERQSSYHDDVGIDVLELQNISQASANQRAGRAGRESPGYCLRLWSQTQHKKLDKRSQPEILRQDISTAILVLKAAGIRNIQEFKFLERPSAEKLAAGEKLLMMIGALDDKGQLTRTGFAMLHYPLSPRLARMMVESERNGCADEISTIVALLSGKSIFLTPPEKANAAREAHQRFAMSRMSDFDTLLIVFQTFVKKDRQFMWCQNNFLSMEALSEATRVKWSLMKTAKERQAAHNRGRVSRQAIMRSIAAGLVDRVARKQENGSYRLATGAAVKRTEHSAVRSEFLIAGSLFLPKKKTVDRVATMSMLMEIDLSEIRQVAPHLFTMHLEILDFFKTTGLARVAMEERYLDLCLAQASGSFVSLKEAQEIQKKTAARARELGLTRVLIERAHARTELRSCVIDGVVVPVLGEPEPGEYWASVKRYGNEIVITPEWRIFPIPNDAIASTSVSLVANVRVTDNLVARLLQS